MSLIRTPVLQYAFVVNDIDAACHQWNQMFGAGPFIKISHYRGIDHQYRGRPAEEDVTHAQGQLGAVQIQFTQQHNDAPSIWHDMYPKGKEGLHHVMIMVQDFEAEIARFKQAGCEVAESFSAQMPEGTQPPVARAAYVDARHKIGHFIEIFEQNPIVQHEFDMLKHLHETWDGKTDLIRSVV